MRLAYFKISRTGDTIMAENTKKTKSASGRGGAVKKSAATQRTAKTPSVSKKAAGNKRLQKRRAEQKRFQMR